jgi:hypothetical protein
MAAVFKVQSSPNLMASSKGDQLGDPGVDERIILKWILKK